MRVTPQPFRRFDVIDRHGRVIILIEDDVGLRGALERVLRASGFEAQAYADAEAALADRSVDWADCLIVDLNLPAMSGLELLHRLRERGVMAPAIAISAQDDERVREEVRRRGVGHFLAKPFAAGELLRVLDSAMESAKDGATREN